MIKDIMTQGFPGGTVVESPPADAGDMGSCPGPRRSHMPRSGWACEPWPLGLCVRSLCSAMGEATTVRGSRTTKKKNELGSTPLFSILYKLYRNYFLNSPMKSSSLFSLYHAF